MLSKILSTQDALRAQPPAFFSVAAHPGVEPEPEPSADPEESDRLRNDNQELHDRIRQLETELAAAKRDSFEAGRRQGDQHARSETAPVLDRLAASLGQLAELRQEIRLRAEKDMVQLALLIAKRILHRELSTDTSALTALARVVFEKMVRGESLRVSVHPAFAPALTAALSKSQTTRVQIEPDPNWPLGTLIVRSEDGILDASVDAQLEEISRGLTDRLAASRSHP